MKNKKYTFKIEKLDNDLNGVAFAGGKKFVIPGTLKGETAECESVLHSGSTVVCRLTSVTEASDERITPECEYGGICGGCDFSFLRYEDQLREKTKMVKRRFLPFTSDVSDIVPVMRQDYRNKCTLAFQYAVDGVRAGFFNSDTHKIIDVERCCCHGKWYEDLRKAALEWICCEKIRLYNPVSGKGVLRFIVGRCLGNNIMVTVVQNSGTKLNYSLLYELLKENFAGVSVYVNINPERTNEAVSGEIKHAAGIKHLDGECCGIKFSLSPGAFYQTNNYIVEKIYSHVLKLVKETGTEKVIDLFSGIGITSSLFAGSGFVVESVEINMNACRDAEKTAEINGTGDKIIIHCGDIGDVLPKINAVKSVLFADPPRAGLGNVVIHQIVKMEIPYIIYMSCNMQSLINDIKEFDALGYGVKSVVPFDMFPHTRHVEAVVMMSRK